VQLRLLLLLLLPVHHQQFHQMLMWSLMKTAESLPVAVYGLIVGACF
jgi:hypothetical protein